MTDQSWEQLSMQAVAFAGVVYFLSLLTLLVHWAALRQVPLTAAEKAERRGDRKAARAAARAARLERAGQAGAGDTGAGGVAVAERADGGAGVDGADRVDGVDGVDRGRMEFTGRLGLLLAVLATALHGFAMVARGLAADPDRVPWGNMYEFTLSGTFFVSLIFLVLVRRMRLEWLAPLVVGFVLTVLMVAVIWLYGPVAPLTEALNSPWLVIHVVSAIIATAAFTLGGLTSILYLVKARWLARSGLTDADVQTGYLARLPGLEALDRISYRIHAFAFPVWTFAVLITGPIWAHEAWSRYWNWDPKEVWAFITWVVYAGYLHARATAGWKGRAAAWVAIIGMATLWFNFIGINYFSTTSQHSYAGGAPVPTQVVGNP